MSLLLRAFQRERTDINTLHSHPIFAPQTADGPIKNKREFSRQNTLLFCEQTGRCFVFGEGALGFQPGSLLSYHINRAGAQMAERDQQRRITATDSPGSGRSRTGRAVALARLLHHECNHLLQLYVSYLFYRLLTTCQCAVGTHPPFLYTLSL